MKIALVHSYYSSAAPSGENFAVDLQAEALGAAGHDVRIVSVRTDDLSTSRLYKAKTALTVATDRGNDPVHELRAYSPDVVHVHNLFPNYSRRWVTQWPGPIVATLHNYRPMCCAGTLSREGADCRDCVTAGNSLPAVRHRCYHDSLAATIPLAIRNRSGLRTDPLLNRADHLIFLAERGLQLYRDGGLARGNVHVIGNFVESPGDGQIADAPSKPWLYAGRLSAEKGIRELLASWPTDRELDIYGDGPLRADVIRQAAGQVRYRGPMQRDELLDRLPGSAGLVFPTRFAEGLPTIYLEALAAGVPVLATRANSAGDDIAACDSGRTIEDITATTLTSAIADIGDDWAGFARRARRQFERRYSEASWIEAMTGIYRQAVDEWQSRQDQRTRDAG